MKKNAPKVSIIMGIYNCETTLREALDSIINQTYKNWELILCDDCSIDKTFSIAKEYADKFPDKVILLKNDTNLTLAPTLNKCLSRATGDYIARQDGDDYSHPQRLEKQVNFLISNTQYDLVATNMISFDEQGQKGIHKLNKNPNKLDLIKGRVPFCHATILMKRDVLISLKGYCEENYAKQAEDFELWSRFFEEEYKGYNLNQGLYYVREDLNAYKRKNIRRRLRGLKLRYKINKRLQARRLDYIYIIKDIIAIFIPQKVLIKYYEWKIG